MADAFQEVLAKLRGWDTENPPEASMIETLATEYQAVTDQRDGATVLISERDEQISELAREVSRLKGENYDLAIRVGIKSAEDDTDKKDDNNSQPRGIHGLFRKVNKA